VAAAMGMTAGFALFWLHVRPDWPLAAGVAAILLLWLSWIVRRPEPRKGQ